ncbi:hypothetical protein Bbelb_073990 [Branchiostoma belcheri]|nr:hypothetical protein Bbelb_073990 [Branchiostoma belcheri]
MGVQSASLKEFASKRADPKLDRSSKRQQQIIAQDTASDLCIQFLVTLGTISLWEEACRVVLLLALSPQNYRKLERVATKHSWGIITRKLKKTLAIKCAKIECKKSFGVI